MFRFTIRDVLWLMVVVGLSVCLWGDRTSLARYRMLSQFDKQQLEKQRQMLGSLEREASKRKKEVEVLSRSLYEAEPGTFYLGPRSDAMSRYNESILGRSGPPEYTQR